MEFNSDNYNKIKESCKDKLEVEFIVEKSATAFSESNAPDSWTAYPPACLPPEGYAQIFYYAGNDTKGALTRLELLVHLDGGRILYKAATENRVALKITWPNTTAE